MTYWIFPSNLDNFDAENEMNLGEKISWYQN